MLRIGPVTPATRLLSTSTEHTDFALSYPPLDCCSITTFGENQLNQNRRTYEMPTGPRRSSLVYLSWSADQALNKRDLMPEPQHRRTFDQPFSVNVVRPAKPIGAQIKWLGGIEKGRFNCGRSRVFRNRLVPPSENPAAHQFLGMPCLITLSTHGVERCQQVP